MQNRIKILKRVLFNAALLIPFILPLATFQTCKLSHEDSTAELLSAKKQNLALQMIQKYDAEMFNCNTKKNFNKTTVLDSIVIGICEKKNNYYIKAKVNTSCSENYFVKLKCGKEILEQYNHTKSNSAYLVARISRIDNINLFADVDSLEGKEDEFALGKSVILSGECLALSEIPSDI